MKKFIISESIFDILPELHIGVVLSKSINNSINHNSTMDLLNASIDNTKLILNNLSVVSDLSCIKGWREVYKLFNEKKNRSSIEALLKRVYNNKTINSINPLVNIYNAVSINYFLPCGGEDIDSLHGDLELSFSNGEELFLPLGSTEFEKPKMGEIIYKNQNDVVCRCFNWRESDKFKLTEETKNAILCMECISKEDVTKLEESTYDLKNKVSSLLNGNCEVFMLNIDNKSIPIG